MQQPDVITMCPPSSISPSISLSVAFWDISSSDRRQVLSRLPSQPPKYKPRDPASVGRPPACLPACYRSIKERNLIRLRDHQPLGRMTHKETQTNIYLQHKHPLLLLNHGAPESPGLNPLLLWGGWKRYPCVVLMQCSVVRRKGGKGGETVVVVVNCCFPVFFWLKLFQVRESGGRALLLKSCIMCTRVKVPARYKSWAYSQNLQLCGSFA